MDQNSNLSPEDLELWMLGASDKELDAFFQALSESLTVQGDKAKGIRLAQLKNLIAGIA